MSSTLLIQNHSGEIYDISEFLASSVSFEDNINKSGILNFSIFNSLDFQIEEGNKIVFAFDSENYFEGYVFKIGYSQSDEIKITAYDQLRYLKANETYVFNGIPASSALKQICNDFKIKTGEIQNTVFKLPELIFDNKAILDIISDCLVATMTKTNQMFFIKDNCGLVELKNISTTISDIVIDPEWLLYGYSYDRSIDDNTYNQIKLIRDNKNTGERELYVAKDSSTIKKWGTLQLTEKVDDNLNPEQIKAMADAYLKLKNKVQQKLTVEITGDKRIRAGNVICVSIPKHSIQDFLLCTYASHTFESTGHTIKADFKIV